MNSVAVVTDYPGFASLMCATAAVGLGYNSEAYYSIADFLARHTPKRGHFIESTRLGFEPRQREPKSLVLPLHYRVSFEVWRCISFEFPYLGIPKVRQSTAGDVAPALILGILTQSVKSTIAGRRQDRSGTSATDRATPGGVSYGLPRPTVDQVARIQMAWKIPGK